MYDKNTLKKHKWNTVIVGAGQMGAGDSPLHESHAQAVTKHNAFQLQAFIESDPKRNNKAQTRWQAKGASSFETLSLNKPTDVFIISSPDHLHEEHLNAALEFNPKCVIVEKPMTLHPDGTDKICERYRQAKCLLVPNYSRRFVPFYQKLHKTIVEEGHVSSHFYYAKGLRHNGCHALDLIHWFFGEIESFKRIDDVLDYSNHDPSVSLSIKTKNASNIILQHLDERCYTHFEFDVFTRKSRYRVYDDHSLVDCHTIQHRDGLKTSKALKKSTTIELPHHSSTSHMLSYVHNKLAHKNYHYPMIEQSCSAERFAHEVSHSTDVCTE